MPLKSMERNFESLQDDDGVALSHQENTFETNTWEEQQNRSIFFYPLLLLVLKYFHEK